MRVRSRGVASVAAAAVLATLPGCSGSEDPAGPSLTIDGIGWYEENLDPTIWASPPRNGQTAFYDFFVHYSGDITFGDIRSARLYLPDGGDAYWDLAPDASFLDTANRTIGGWRRWFASTPNLLPIGTVRAEVTLTNGRVATASLLVPAPGSTGTDGYASIHTEDLLSPPATSVAMIPRATMGAPATVTPASQTIDVAFSVDDARVENGWVWLFDSVSTYLGGFCCFRDTLTGAIAPQLGGALHTDGTPNRLTLVPADVVLEPGMRFDQIAKVRVVLTDGRQYASSRDGYLRYDCRSVGAAVTLTVQ